MARPPVKSFYREGANVCTFQGNRRSICLLNRRSKCSFNSWPIAHMDEDRTYLVPSPLGNDQRGQDEAEMSGYQRF